MKKKIQKNSGFSFLESIISVFILSFGIVAVLPLITSSLNDSHDSRDQMIAAFLAQEGVELVYNIRDNNWAKEDYAFEANFPTANENNPDCRVDYTSTSIGNSDCDVNGDKKLYWKSNYYTHDSSGSGVENTKFQRKISMVYYESNGSSETTYDLAAMAKVTSTVVWGRNDFPNPSDPDASKRGCNTKNKCSEVSVTLTTWH